jgi:hypothetical protein
MHFLLTTGLTWTFTTINVLAFAWSTLLAIDILDTVLAFMWCSALLTVVLGIDLVFVCCYAMVTIVIILGIDFEFE